MQTELILSGFGGQGIMFAGQIVSYAAMDAGKQVTWIPSYGPEMRGGTANCTVVVADDEIGSPVVKNPDAVLAMNLPSLDKYEPMIKPGGVLVVNASMVDRLPKRADIKFISVPCNEIAEEIGNARLANMVAVGALMEMASVLTVDDIESALSIHMPGRHKHLLPKNVEAVKRGAEYVRANRKT
jgi:2-oxoglutarate ferredoxin oxidoreductase subunit gamma